MRKHVLISTDSIGRSNRELGEILIRSFLHTLARAEPRPLSLMLMNEGVRLACEGSKVEEDLRLLVDAGVPVKACGTCLDFLGLGEKLIVGEVGNMAGTVETLLGDECVVTVG